jgi:hypothetical protein
MLLSRYASWRRGSRRRRSSLVACCALRPAVRAQEFAAFTEENFEAFLLNAQSSICEEVRQADFLHELSLLNIITGVQSLFFFLFFLGECGNLVSIFGVFHFKFQLLAIINKMRNWISFH